MNLRHRHGLPLTRPAASCRGGTPTQNRSMHAHNNYPLAPDQVKVNENMLSDYCKQIKDDFNISVAVVHKLTPILSNKKKVRFASS